MSRPYVTVVLAMSADGKIADVARSPARFGSSSDKAHLERQVAHADGVLFGAETLRAYGTTLPVTSPDLLAQREEQGKLQQPIHIVCSASGQLDPTLKFFQQGVPRWLITSESGADLWQNQDSFDRILIGSSSFEVDWHQALQKLYAEGIERLAVTGGGRLVAALFHLGAVDELWLTVCPRILGGAIAPSPVGGDGFLEMEAPYLELLSAKTVDQEVFLHYRVVRSTQESAQNVEQR
ncbi:RibD family protein [Leptolyngbya sp. AN02str]|uniref:RibD family protein n=1 Tax=Leptolyngbya sp. AN02str TaxID=3423363 RepID=UPI003D3228AA